MSLQTTPVASQNSEVSYEVVIQYICPHCNAQQESSAAFAGQTVACSCCQGEIILPKENELVYAEQEVKQSVAQETEQVDKSLPPSSPTTSEAPNPKITPQDSALSPKPNRIAKQTDKTKNTKKAKQRKPKKPSQPTKKTPELHNQKRINQKSPSRKGSQKLSTKGSNKSSSKVHQQRRTSRSQKSSRKVYRKGNQISSQNLYKPPKTTRTRVNKKRNSAKLNSAKSRPKKVLPFIQARKSYQVACLFLLFSLSFHALSPNAELSQTLAARNMKIAGLPTATNTNLALTQFTPEQNLTLRAPKENSTKRQETQSKSSTSLASDSPQVEKAVDTKIAQSSPWHKSLHQQLNKQLTTKIDPHTRLTSKATPRPNLSLSPTFNSEPVLHSLAAQKPLQLNQPEPEAQQTIAQITNLQSASITPILHLGPPPEKTESWDDLLEIDTNSLISDNNKQLILFDWLDELAQISSPSDLLSYLDYPQLFLQLPEEEQSQICQQIAQSKQKLIDYSGVKQTSSQALMLLAPEGKSLFLWLRDAKHTHSSTPLIDTHSLLSQAQGGLKTYLEKPNGISRKASAFICLRPALHGDTYQHLTEFGEVIEVRKSPLKEATAEGMALLIRESEAAKQLLPLLTEPVLNAYGELIPPPPLPLRVLLEPLDPNNPNSPLYISKVLEIL